MNAPFKTAPSSHHHRHVRRAAWLTEARALLVLAAPMIVTQLAQMAIMTTDVVLLGRLSKTALASAAIGNAVYYFTWLTGFGPASAVSPMIAHIRGASPRNKAGIRASVRMGLWAAVLISLPLTGILLTATPILIFLHQDPELARGAGVFVAALAIGLPFSMGFQVLRNFAAALERPNAAMWVMGASIVFNALAAWSLIFGHFGLPALGLLGSGLATSFSAVFAFLAMLVVVALTPELRQMRIGRRFHKLAGSKLAEVMRLGMPIGMTMMFEAMLFNASTLVMGTFGAASVAAHQIALNFASVTFMVPLGIGMASCVRVGVFTGAGDRAGARHVGLTAVTMAVGFIALVGIAMALFGRQIAGLYFGSRVAENADVIGLAGTFLMVAAAFQLFDAAQVVGAQSLRGLKDTRVPMVLAGGSYWLAGAPMCLVLAFGFHMAGLGVWIGLAFGLAVAAVAMCGRFWGVTREAA
jgi:MATE family multidrug resistance protein